MLVLNRSAVVVRAKQPFLDWLWSVDPSSRHHMLNDVNDQPSIYLLPECESEEESAKALRKFCKDIFEERLNGWWRDVSVWPKDLSFRAFVRWFDYSRHEIIFDLVKAGLTREEM